VQWWLYLPLSVMFCIWGNGPALWRLHRKCFMQWPWSIFQQINLCLVLHLFTMLTTEAVIITNVDTIFGISFHLLHETWGNGRLVAFVLLHFLVPVLFCVVWSHQSQLLFVACSVTFYVARVSSWSWDLSF